MIRILRHKTRTEMTPSRNGATAVEDKHLTYDDKLDILIQGVAELTEKVDTLTEQNEELAEKLANITASGAGFEIDEYDS